MKDEDITAALEIIDAASEGPARWTNPCTGLRPDGKPNHPIAAFAEMLGCTIDVEALPRSVSDECHGVSIPDPERGSHSVADIEAGGDHKLVAITGNGPTSRANARAIAGMLDPVAGWRAALLEVRRHRAYERELAHELSRVKAERDQAIARQDRSLVLAELEGACSALDELRGMLQTERNVRECIVLSGDGETSRPMSDAEVLKEIMTEREQLRDDLLTAKATHEDLREEVFSAIEGGLGIMTATPGPTIRAEGIRLHGRVRELRRELVRIHSALGDCNTRLARELPDGGRSALATVGDCEKFKLAEPKEFSKDHPNYGDAHVLETFGGIRALIAVAEAVAVERKNIERPELRLTDWGDGVVNDEPGMTIIDTEASRVDASEGASRG